VTGKRERCRGLKKRGEEEKSAPIEDRNWSALAVTRTEEMMKKKSSENQRRAELRGDKWWRRRSAPKEAEKDASKTAELKPKLSPDQGLVEQLRTREG